VILLVNSSSIKEIRNSGSFLFVPISYKIGKSNAECGVRISWAFSSIEALSLLGLSLRGSNSGSVFVYSALRIPHSAFGTPHSAFVSLLLFSQLKTFYSLKLAGHIVLYPGGIPPFYRIYERVGNDY
jgi:hypothetical protein